MTTATQVTRRQARVTLAAAGCAAALLLTGCSDSGASGDGASATPGASSSSSSASADSGGNSTSQAGKAGKLEGSWLATTGGKAVALVINGRQAGLFAMGGTVCSGTAGEEAGMQMIHLKCTGGSKGRSTGMVDSVTSGSMKVTWEGGVGTETYTKAEGGTLPSGFPTASLG
ncbi:hypothetical protein ACWEWI_18950 [Streptomyces sp. NPDC003753]|uniref:hypothetical protein n=1 Tax=Streptomyces sp. Y2F8-2 TaxID=2759675 RepID=UPI001905C811|nr:hypothetical protein [Streptomyces sp. Y2F8-2]GHK04418.1 hypothetical protein SY2F82_62150 [Streptomyces sp. Y2F8-2]